ncbi:MAG TPA: hypothetical protein VF163_00855, partial [Micromonosporaceae bacterium]
MRSELPRRRSAQSPSDAELADQMRLLADAFVSGSEEGSDPFGWDVTEVARLDEVCDEFLRRNPPEYVRQSMTESLGAYLGELLVRHGDGRWHYDPERRLGLVVLPEGAAVDPRAEVARRHEPGSG